MPSSRIVFAQLLGIVVSVAVVRGPSAGYANLVIDFSSGFTRITTGANDAVRAVRGGGD